MEAGTIAQPGKPAPYGQACAACSKAKCRCITRGAGSSCERCHRLGKECIPSAAVRKRGSKKQATTSRRAQLEEKLDGLVSLLREQNGLSNGPTADNGLYQVFPSDFAQQSRSRLLHQIATTPAATVQETNHSSPESAAAPTRIQELPPAQADQYLRDFRTYNLKYFPFVYIPQDVTAQQLQEERPFLWLNIRTVCARSADEQSELSNIVRETLGKQLLVEMERSFDLLLGVLAFIAWSMYHVRGKPYLRLCSSLVTALIGDLGIDLPIREESFAHLSCFKPYSFPKWTGGIEVLTNEHRRALAAAFITTSFISSFLKIECVRWTPHLEECLDRLSRDNECPGDEVLVSMARIFQVAEEAAQISWRMEEDHSNAPAMLHIKGLRASLEQVKNKPSPDLLQNYLIQTHLTSTEVLIHEMARFHRASSPLHGTCDFRRTEFLHSCLKAAKAHLDNFFALSPTDYRGMPLTVMVQFSHSAQVLYRLALLDDTGWDGAAVLNVANLLEYIERFAANMDQYQRTVVSRCGSNVPDVMLFSRASQALRATIPIWAAALEQAGAIPPGGGVTSASAPADDAAMAMMPGIEGQAVAIMDFSDDAWLTDIFASWAE